MSKEIYISSTPHETRLAIVENDDLTEIYYERENEYTLAGSIYNGKVTRVLPGMQSSFVDVGLERDAFLYITDFMEEAGETADFDSAEGGDSRGRGRSDRSRGSREGAASNGQAALPESSEAASEPTTARSDRGDRGDRNDRRRRGGRRDEQTVPPRVSAEPAVSSYAGEPPVGSDELYEVPALQDAGAEAGSASEMGEGAPGADGSRRWRGRRGRRRGRGSATREPGTVVDETSSAAAEPPLDAASDDASEFEETFELDGAAEDTAANDAYSSPQEPAADRPERFSRRPQDLLREQPAGVPPSAYEAPTHREDAPGRDRSRRDRDRREPRDRDSREPRGFAPRGSYGAYEDESAPTPAGEPIVLPGESLAKYRPGSDAPTAASAESAPAPAAALQEFVLEGWDGGAVLPGETLRPRSRSSESSAESSRESNRGARDFDRGGRRDSRDTDRRGSRGDRSSAAPRSTPPDRSSAGDRFRTGERPQRSDESRRGTQDDPNQLSASYVVPAAAPVPFRAAPPAAPEAAGFDSLGEPAGEITNHITPDPQQAAPAHNAPTAAPIAEPIATLEAAEYEPTEASASHRFDPAPPREYRQPVASPVIEEDPEFATKELTAAPEPVGDPDAGTAAESETAPSSALATHRITPAAGVPLRPLVFRDADDRDRPAPLHLDSRPEPHADPELPTAEFTAIAADGEMRSEHPLPPPQEIASPASPIEHETALLDDRQHATLAELSASHAPEAISQATASDVAGFNHDIDSAEDDTRLDTASLNASAIEEIDYDEEETLEGAADLGTMIREMSIDQITHASAELDDDPGFDDEMAFEEQDALDDAGPRTALEEEPELNGDQEGDDDAEVYADESAATTEQTGEENGHAPSPTTREHDGGSGRRFGRRDGRRDGRRGSRSSDRSDDRPRSTGGSGDRTTGMRPGRRDHRHSAQTTNLPAISDLLKPGQELLVQIAKEPIAKKGARITSHIALPGRFLVFMPTVHHTGVSRKIESDGERRRLKEILLSEKGEASGGFIVRTAAANASEEELRSDLRFLLNLWADIKQRSESSKSPALIYHDLNLVERILRDQVTDTFSAIWVDTETEYERVLRFLQRFQPSLIRRVKLYTKETPLFEQFGLTEEINKALRSKVWLKSGGSIVINQTEALVAIDINTGKYRRQDRPPRRHHRQDQPRCHPRNRPSDPSARSRRHHHHRLHRHGRAQEPQSRHGRAGRRVEERSGPVQGAPVQ